ncbi:MAG: protein-containing protein [Anaerocolumna sp.]|jgi:predicted DNA-binding transcriptional regulator YafY|nr:protein-containing protein [Anaerocolumna sp.]
MELFSEIYSCYYSVTTKILQSSPLTDKQINSIIHTNAFSESALFLHPKLCKSDGWGLISKQNNNYQTNLTNSPKLPITLLEKRWLKSLIHDPRIRLFMDEDALLELSNKLSEIKPLYRNEQFKWFDIFSDGDNYSNKTYIKIFKLILSAIKNKDIIKIEFTSGKGRTVSHDYFPYRLEYSQKNDKFRVFVAKMKGLQSLSLGTINLSRIKNIQTTERHYSINVDMDKVFKWKRCHEPVHLEISNERNGLERFMMEFAAYEKHTELDEISGNCIAKLWYDSQDETEVLIRLLGFGPVIKILGPERMLKQVHERVNKQYNLLFQNNIFPNDILSNSIT